MNDQHQWISEAIAELLEEGRLPAAHVFVCEVMHHHDCPARDGAACDCRERRDLAIVRDTKDRALVLVRRRNDGTVESMPFCDEVAAKLRLEVSAGAEEE